MWGKIGSTRSSKKSPRVSFRCDELGYSQAPQRWCFSDRSPRRCPCLTEARWKPPHPRQFYVDLICLLNATPSDLLCPCRGTALEVAKLTLHFFPPLLLGRRGSRHPPSQKRSGAVAVTARPLADGSAVPTLRFRPDGGINSEGDGPEEIYWLGVIDVLQVSHALR